MQKKCYLVDTENVGTKWMIILPELEADDKVMLFYTDASGKYSLGEIQALDCEFYNRNLEEEDVCYNCSYFMGGGDWGLACSKHYNRLPNATSRICDDFARKSDENKE